MKSFDLKINRIISISFGFDYVFSLYLLFFSTIFYFNAYIRLILIDFIIFSLFTNEFLPLTSLFDFSVDTSTNRVIFYSMNGSVVFFPEI